ncbi:MAG TPA: hypothetical protein DD666_17560 [Advenella kashmirensis]|uniref:Uncharacterized protein n=1 Tax=Advenella kashmirensis TaxID=310575 RepID=A0A356LJV5_9BURK|nr:hypothetical protein [Advenella kashmirensis]
MGRSIVAVAGAAAHGRCAIRVQSHVDNAFVKAAIHGAFFELPRCSCLAHSLMGGTVSATYRKA